MDVVLAARDHQEDADAEGECGQGDPDQGSA
jgi:hypothetical protein